MFEDPIVVDARDQLRAALLDIDQISFAQQVAATDKKRAGLLRPHRAGRIMNLGGLGLQAGQRRIRFEGFAGRTDVGGRKLFLDRGKSECRIKRHSEKQQSNGNK